jgi:hypothetical protein
MIVTIADARRIIARHYGEDFAKSVRFRANGCAVYVRSFYETSFGKPTLCSRKLAPGPDSVVRIGRMLSSGAIDWAWDDTARVALAKAGAA